MLAVGVLPKRRSSGLQTSSDLYIVDRDLLAVYCVFAVSVGDGSLEGYYWCRGKLSGRGVVGLTVVRWLRLYSWSTVLSDGGRGCG